MLFKVSKCFGIVAYQNIIVCGILKLTTDLVRDEKVLILLDRKMQNVQAGGRHCEHQDEQRGRICLDIETAEKKISRR